ncbi:MAG: hypothetical protein ACPHN2_04145 [Sinimarinibacterium flocculans]|uniref:hypothetical protein n=1 Tax=Sinimarinibacterium flocculans TaxID=985250 RepID=UPI003C52F030
MTPDADPQSALVNTGLQWVNVTDPPDAERTLIVLGVARSGTTMVAGALQQLGVDMMGGQKPNPVFEDLELGHALEAGDGTLASRLIRERDAGAAVWGWKRPSAIGYMRRSERLFRNPCYVVVFRDLLAIANRNRISVQANLLDNLDETLAHYRRLLAFLRRSRRPMLLVSYEKAMLDRRAFVDALARLAPLPTADQRVAAEEFIRTNSEAYLVSARNWRAQGELSSVEADRIMGWAYVPGDASPVVVRLTINGRLFGTQVADLPRPPLKARGQHPTGLCGFNFRLPLNKRLQAGDRVSVRVVGEAQDVRLSPRRHRPEPESASESAPQRD